MAGPSTSRNHKRGASDGQDAAAPAPKRPSKEQTRPQEPSYTLNNKIFQTLGGRWENLPPFVGDESKLYRWIAEPALWGRIIMGENCEPRAQQRIVGLHAALHDGLDASGFVLWRTFHPLQKPCSLTVRSAGESRIPDTRLQLPSVTIRQQKLQRSSRFGEGWEMRTHAGPPASPSAAPAWLKSGWRLIQAATFPFLGAPMPVVDAAWTSDRFGRTDAITHCLVETSPGAGINQATCRRGLAGVQLNRTGRRQGVVIRQP